MFGPCGPSDGEGGREKGVRAERKPAAEASQVQEGGITFKGHMFLPTLSSENH